MRKYRIDASSTVRFEYGVELVAGLFHFPETAPIAGGFESLNDELAAQHRERITLRAPMLRARARMRLAEHHVDQMLRSAARAAEITDGGRRGRIAGTLLPDGLKPVVAPRGRAQLKPTRELVERLAHAKVAGIEAYRSEWLPRLEAALARLEAAVGEYEGAQAAHREAFKIEVALREAHHDAVDRIMGQVRAAFPRDRAIQDLIFPAPEADVVLAGEEGADVEEEGAPSHPLPPAEA